MQPGHTESLNWIHRDFVYLLLSKMSDRTMARQVLLFIWFLSLSSALGQVSYSIPEEMAKGSLVGNIAQDLGLDLKRLKSGKARIYTGDSAEYIELNKERGSPPYQRENRPRDAVRTDNALRATFTDYSR